MKKILCGILAFFVLTVSGYAKDFYGSVRIGYGSLLGPDLAEATGPNAYKGGLDVLFQGLWGNGKLKYGGEIGVMEIYKNIDDNGRLVAADTLSAIPLNGLLEYDLSFDESLPYFFGGPGAYFAIESGDLTNNTTNPSASSSSVYSGITLGSGIKIAGTNIWGIHLSARYTAVFASETISLVNFNIGVKSKMSFIKEEKSADFKIPSK